jgi:hypothetical protein
MRELWHDRSVSDALANPSQQSAFHPIQPLCRRANERPLRKNGAARLNGGHGREPADALQC